MRFNVRRLATSGSLLIVLLTSLLFVIKTPALKTYAANTPGITGITVPKMLLPWDKNFLGSHYTGGPHGGRTTTPCVLVNKSVASGIDFGMPQNTDLLSPFNAKMVFAGVFPGLTFIRGVVILQSLDSPNFFVELWHLNYYDATLLNQNIAAGTLVSKSGFELDSQGNQVSHLHIEFRYGTFNASDPYNSLTPYPANGITIDGYKAWTMPPASNKSQTFNYEGTLTKGKGTNTQTITDCGTSATETVSSDPNGSTIFADVASTTAVISTNAESKMVWRQSTVEQVGTSNFFNAVTAVSATDVWAAGTMYVSQNVVPLIEHWDGAQWHNSPLPSDIQGQLYGISALNANDIWTVGFGGPLGGGGDLPITFHWDGSNWTYIQAASPYAHLDSVTALALNNVWAVGYTVGQSALIEHWDGSTWTVIPTPNATNIADSNISLRSIAANSSSDIWTVGDINNSQNLDEHWDGKSWSISSVPNQGVIYNGFNGVTAISSKNIWAVGYSGDSYFSYHSIAFQWTGNSWVQKKTIGLTVNSIFHAVAAFSGADIMAVGYYGNDNLTEHYNGHMWNVTGDPPTDSGQELNGVSKIPGTTNQYVAVGSNQGAMVAIAEIYGPTGPMTSTP